MQNKTLVLTSATVSLKDFLFNKQINIENNQQQKIEAIDQSVTLTFEKKNATIITPGKIQWTWMKKHYLCVSSISLTLCYE